MTQEKHNEHIVPLLLSATDLQIYFHFHRSMCYVLLQRPECGALRIGKRRFLDRDRFMKWLSEQNEKEAK